MRREPGRPSAGRLSAVLLAVVGAMIIWGCASKPALVPGGAPPRVAELIHRLQEEDTRLYSLQAVGSLRWIREGEKFSMDHVMVLRRPGTLRLEGLSPLGSGILSLAIRKGEAELYVPGESRAIRGPATERIMERLFALPMGVEEVIGVLCGRPPLCSHESAKVRSEGGVWVLEMDCPDSGRHEQIKVDPALGDPVSMVLLSPSGQVMATVSWSGYQKVDGLRLPTEIRADLPSKASRLELRLKDLEPNLQIPDERFKLNIPVDIKVEPLS